MTQTWWVSEPQSIPAQYAKLSMAFLSKPGPHGPPRCPPVPVLAIEAHTPPLGVHRGQEPGHRPPPGAHGTGGAWLLPAPWPAPSAMDGTSQSQEASVQCTRPLAPPSALRAPGEPVDGALRDPRAAVRGTGARGPKPAWHVLPPNARCDGPGPSIEAVIQPGNLEKVLARVRRNRGCPASTV